MRLGGSLFLPFPMGVDGREIILMVSNRNLHANCQNDGVYEETGYVINGLQEFRRDSALFSLAFFSRTVVGF
jgi:hypothetical protein